MRLRAASPAKLAVRTNVPGPVSKGVKNMKFLSGRFGLALLLAGLIGLTACVPSLNPVYSPETLVFRDELLGIWKEDTQDEASWKFTRADENSYTVTLEEKEEKSSFEGRLVKLGDAYFLDLFPSGEPIEKAKMGGLYKASLIPGHLILKVAFDPGLELWLLQPDELKEILTNDPGALAHALPATGQLVITAPTAELQKFLQKQVDNAALWGEPEQLQKLLL